MAYKETSVTGTSDNKFVVIHIENYRDSVPVVTAQEQRRTILSDGSKIDNYVGEVKFDFDPSFVFPVLDADGEPTGQYANGASVYQGIYSYLMAKVFERDNSLANPEENP